MNTSPNVLAVLQARTTSSRLSGKVLADLEGAPMILRQIERISRARRIDKLVLATSADASDDRLANVLKAANISVWRGSLDDVLDRFASAVRGTKPRHVVRLTGDCPLADPQIIDAVIEQHVDSDADITTNALEPTLPDGLDVEVMRADVLLTAAAEAALTFEREHVTQFLYRRPDRFRIAHYRHPRDFSGLRWTVDEPEDLAFVRAVFGALYRSQPDFGLEDVLALLARRPELSAINSGFQRNEGLARSMAAEAGH
ncbi:MAG TPA: glycosyltransferase family protein [Xanthobacteraceae bacterium]|nr:glycosyltransferase family protein [Xanthobacteraceae bacterium]